MLTRLRWTVGALSSVEHSGSVMLRSSSALIEMDSDRVGGALFQESAGSSSVACLDAAKRGGESD